MKELMAAQVTPALKALFRTDYPLPARCPSILEGIDVGKIFTDDPMQPTWGIVQELYRLLAFLVLGRIVFY